MRPFPVLLILLGAALAGCLFIRAHYRDDAVSAIANNLETINAYKAEQLDSWLRNLEREGARLSRHPFLGEIVEQEIGRPGSRRAQLLPWLTDHTAQKRYFAMAFLSPKGGIITATPRYVAGVEPAFKEAFSRAVQKGTPQLTDLYLDVLGRPRMSMFAPISTGRRGGKPLCVLAIKIDPDNELYPLIKATPLLFSKATTLLVRQEGKNVLYLNELDDVKDSRLKFTRPLDSEHLPAAAAIKGVSGFFAGTDYAGTKVFSAVSHIENPRWGVITKIDQGNVMAPVRPAEYLLMSVLVLAALLLYAAFNAVLAARERAGREALTKAEAAFHESEKIFNEFMEHSPIYVFFKDENIRAMRLSRNFEKMIGKPLADCLGKNMNELFPLPLAEKMVADDMRIIKEGKEVTIEEEFNGRRYVTTKFPIKVEGKPAYLAGYTIDVTERKLAEQERLAHIRFLEHMDKVNRAIQTSADIEKLMGNILNTVLKIFDCDRIWLFYPCDPDSPHFRVPMEVTKPEYPGAKVLNVDLPMPPDMANDLREALKSAVPVTYTAGTPKPVNKVSAEQFGVRSQMFTAVYPKVGKPWAFGIHQCSHARVWTTEETRLFQEIARRLTDALTSLLSTRDLRENEQRLKEAQRLASIGNWTLDLLSGKLSWSDEIYSIFELDPAKFGASYEAFLDAIHPGDREMVNKAYTDSVKSRSPYNITHRLLMKDGRIKYVIECCETFYGPDGKPLRSVGTVQDVTERTTAEQEKARLLERLNLAKTAAGIGVWDWDIPANRLTWDDKMFDLYGVLRKDFPVAYEAWLAGIHPEDRERCNEESRRALVGEQAYDTEFRIVRPGGEVRWLKAIADIFKDADGKPKRMVGVNFDITDTRRAEEKLRESEERLRVTLEETQIGTWDWDVTKDVWQASPTYFTMLGYKAEPGPSDRKVWLGRVHPDDREYVASKIASVLAGADAKYQYETRMRHADGTYRWHLVLGTTVERGPAGKPARMMGVRIDITQRKLAEDALRESEERLRSLWTHMAEGVALHELVCGADGRPENYRIIETNPQFESILGIKTDHIAGKLATEAYGTPAPPYLEEYAAVAVSGKPASMEVYFEPLRKHFAISIAPWGAKGFATIFSDVTARRKAELETEKLNRELISKNQEMENFLYITTHDLRSPLVNIQGFSQNLQHYLEESQELLNRPEGVPPKGAARLKELTSTKVPEALDFILGSSRKMDALITALLKVSRAGRVEMKPEKLDMGEIIRKVTDSMRFQLQEAGADIRTGALPPCVADPVAASQIFANLLDNSVKYRDRSRRLTLELTGEVKGDVAAYTVADNGPGIPQKDLDRIWNVFYSHERDAQGRGEGIGLPMVKRMVEKNGGSIRAESNEGQGTVFHIELPAVREG